MVSSVASVIRSVGRSLQVVVGAARVNRTNFVAPEGLIPSHGATGICETPKHSTAPGDFDTPAGVSTSRQPDNPRWPT